jgi:CPA2 family monovalent cation:H+ antiporter-2
VASALLSISLNPLLFRASGRIENWLRGRPRIWRILSARAEARGRMSNETMIRTLDEAKDQIRAVVVGYGPVGQTVTRILSGFGKRGPPRSTATPARPTSSARPESTGQSISC